MPRATAPAAPAKATVQTAFSYVDALHRYPR